MDSLIIDSVSKATWNKHCSAWTLFDKFCDQHKCKPEWPVDIKTVRAFVTWGLRDKKLKHSTMSSYLSSLNTKHAIKGIPCEPFVKDKVIAMLIKGAENSPSGVMENKISVNPPLLSVFGHCIATANWTNYSKQLIWTVFLTAFFSSCRMGEILSESSFKCNYRTAFLWKNLKFLEGDGAIIFLPFTKAKKFAGDFLDLFIFPIKNYCPVTNLLQLRSMQIDLGIFDENSPVFKFNSGALVSKSKVNEILCSFTKNSLPPEFSNVTGHSFRSGLATLMPAIFGPQTDCIKVWGRWASDSYKLYNKNARECKRKMYLDIVPTLIEFWK